MGEGVLDGATVVVVGAGLAAGVDVGGGTSAGADVGPGC